MKVVRESYYSLQMEDQHSGKLLERCRTANSSLAVLWKTKNLGNEFSIVQVVDHDVIYLQSEDDFVLADEYLRKKKALSKLTTEERKLLGL